MKIQFASDLHLEFERTPADRLQFPLAPRADVLVLAGDIHNDVAGLIDFVSPLAAKLPVLLLAGNHEFYFGDIDAVRRELRVAADRVPGLHVLDNDRIDINGVRFLGATLWAGLDDADPALLRLALELMSDYEVIRDASDRSGWLRPERTVAEFARSREYLERELSASFAGPTVVVTHHAPSLRSSGVKGEHWDVLYGTDLEALMHAYAPAAWIHGHVHASLEYRVGSTVVACNPRGYVGVGENPDFEPRRTIEIQGP